MKISSVIYWNLLFFITFSMSLIPRAKADTVIENPGIPESESFEISDRIDQHTGYVIALVNISVQRENNKKIYFVKVTEGDRFVNTIQLDYNTLTTISEYRYDYKTRQLVESYLNKGNGIVHFFNRETGIDKQFTNSDKNIYSRYAYFLSFEGFPFEVGKSVFFSSYMSEYGDALPMKLNCIAKESVTVKAGIFECYKLELTVAGWQALFSSDKYYLYYAVESPHRFIKYEEKDKDGKWYANEFIRIIK